MSIPQEKEGGISERPPPAPPGPASRAEDPEGSQDPGALFSDSGGTFAACVLNDGRGRIWHDKAFSDPEDMEGSVLSAIQNVATLSGKDLPDLLPRF